MSVPDLLQLFGPTASHPLSLTVLVRAMLVPAMLGAITAIHAAYVRVNWTVDGQQRIALQDYTALTDRSAVANRTTVVHARHTEFDIQARASRPAALAAPAPAPFRLHQSVRWVDQSLRMAEFVSRRVLICDEDLEISGTTLFHGAVKVGGDLIVSGRAVFLEPVVVDGVLRVSGFAHFAGGLVGKGDALITGSLLVGSDRTMSWAVLRDVMLRERLGLNGTLVANRAVQLAAAA